MSDEPTTQAEPLTPEEEATANLRRRDFSDEDDDGPRCDTCGRQVGLSTDLTDTPWGLECRDCSGLARCCDDMCHGAGYCLHDPLNLPGDEP